LSQDRSLRPTIIIVCGTIAVALIGWFSNHIAGRFENARLLTNLQIQREEAESNLRGVIFDQTMKTFLNDPSQPHDRSKQLLQLELLSLNFGDTVSLAPLFVEFRRDLDRTKASSSVERETVLVYKRRLRNLARRVASKQFSGIALHGVAQDSIDIQLNTQGSGFANGLNQFVWPRHQAELEFGFSMDEIKQGLGKEIGLAPEDFETLQHDFQQRIASLECMQLDNSMRRVEVTVSSPNSRDMTANVQLKIWNVPSCAYNYREKGELIIDRDFTLDFFNFPKIDNTRLTNNQRFALIMESYDEEVGKIDMAAVIFPSEYASLSDRPGMKEAIQIMEKALDAD
jgi:hypothetical protein